MLITSATQSIAHTARAARRVSRACWRGIAVGSANFKTKIVSPAAATNRPKSGLKRAADVSDTSDTSDDLGQTSRQWRSTVQCNQTMR